MPNTNTTMNPMKRSISEEQRAHAAKSFASMSPEQILSAAKGLGRFHFRAGLKATEAVNQVRADHPELDDVLGHDAVYRGWEQEAESYDAEGLEHPKKSVAS